MSQRYVLLTAMKIQLNLHDAGTSEFYDETFHRSFFIFYLLSFSYFSHCTAAMLKRRFEEFSLLVFYRFSFAETLSYDDIKKNNTGC